MATRILVVDDQPEFLDLLEAVLGREGYEVRKADRAAKALELLRAETPAVMVLDLMMPEQSGIDFLRQIRSDTQFAELPVVCISALRMEGETLDFIQAQSLGLVDKVRLHEVVDAIRRALGSA